ncbi:hypothetical protein [Pontibacter chitinilyticus]|uniref:hypothetical protein n=1 Tax=Pontibacter chitinilyticus TaxID=2674989 RepID=UPI0032193CA0
MKYSFYYGPDKVPFSLDEQDSLVTGDAEPFHGIISRGLLDKFEEEKVNSNVWYHYAHAVNAAAAFPQAPELTLLQEYAYTCQLLAFNHSAAAVRNYLTYYIRKFSKKKQLAAEVWNIKEGHTSSVWLVGLLLKDHSVADRFVVNVARDKAGGLELKHTSEKMQAIAKMCPAINMAQVYDIKSIKLKYFGKWIEVVVTRNEFVTGAQEIHVISGKESSSVQYILVERFLTSDNNPAQIAAVRGRRFTEAECCKIESDLRSFKQNASGDLDTEININDGDVVWNGKEAVVVAIT